jgi:hypothetical protein
LLQASNLIVTVVGHPGALYVVLFILISELVPAAALLDLYGAKSAFVKNKNKSAKSNNDATGSTRQKEVKLKTKATPSSALEEQ